MMVNDVKPTMLIPTTQQAIPTQSITTAFYTPRCHHPAASHHIFYTHHPISLPMTPPSGFNLQTIPKSAQPQGGVPRFANGNAAFGHHPWGRNEMKASAASIREIEDKISQINIAAAIKSSKTATSHAPSSNPADRTVSESES